MENDKLNQRYFWLPNSITALRLLGTAALLFVRPLTVPFTILYTLTGISDAADGWLARSIMPSTKPSCPVCINRMVPIIDHNPEIRTKEKSHGIL